MTARGRSKVWCPFVARSQGRVDWEGGVKASPEVSKLGCRLGVVVRLIEVMVVRI